MKNELDFNSSIYEKIEVENPKYKNLFIKKLLNISKKHLEIFNQEKTNLLQSGQLTLNKTLLLHSNQNNTSQKKITTEIKITTNDDGNMQINNYLILENLGKGSFGTVKLCYNILDEKYYVNLNLFRQ